MNPKQVEGETAAMSEPTDKFPVTAHEWLQDALGRYQVTHIHSSIREALRAMDLTEEDKEIIAPKPSTAAKEEIAPSSEFPWRVKRDLNILKAMEPESESE